MYVLIRHHDNPNELIQTLQHQYPGLQFSITREEEIKGEKSPNAFTELTPQTLSNLSRDIEDEFEWVTTCTVRP